MLGAALGSGSPGRVRGGEVRERSVERAVVGNAVAGERRRAVDGGEHRVVDVDHVIGQGPTVEDREVRRLGGVVRQDVGQDDAGHGGAVGVRSRGVDPEGLPDCST